MCGVARLGLLSGWLPVTARPRIQHVRVVAGAGLAHRVSSDQEHVARCGVTPRTYPIRGDLSPDRRRLDRPPPGRNGPCPCWQIRGTPSSASTTTTTPTPPTSSPHSPASWHDVQAPADAAGYPALLDLTRSPELESSRSSATLPPDPGGRRPPCAPIGGESRPSPNGYFGQPDAAADGMADVALVSASVSSPLRRGSTQRDRRVPIASGDSARGGCGFGDEHHRLTRCNRQRCSTYPEVVRRLRALSVGERNV